MTKNRIDSLTSLRAFAAAALLYFHQMRIVVPVDSNPSFALGVSFFFVLSGFILYVNYGAIPQDRVRRFALARFARLYPVHIATFLIFALIFAPTIFLQSDFYGLLAINAALIHAWIPKVYYNLSMNTVSWSVSTELGFYLAFPFLARIKNFAPAFFAVLVAVVVLILTIEHFNNGLTPPASRWEFTPSDFVLMSPLVRIAEFSAGVWFAKLYEAGVLSRVTQRYGSALEMLALGGVVAFGIYNHDASDFVRAHGHPVLAVWVDTSSGMFFMAFLLLVVAYQKGIVSRILNFPSLVFLGESSFSLYMVHGIVISVFTIFHLMEGVHWSIRFLTISAICYVCSWLLFLLVERPCRNLILGFGRPRNPSQKLALPL